jgi:osmoprotectant transport system permease protein
MALGFGVAFPLGVVLSRASGMQRWVTGLFNGVRVIPSLAVVSLMIPLLGTGFKPALLALVLLAIPPILIQTGNGLSQVAPEIQEAALGMGMNRSELFWRVNLPLAWPSILTGLRTATVEVLAGATLAALVGGGGLGVFIINGLGMYQFSLLMVGALPIIVLVLLVEGGFSLLERFSLRYRAC